MGGDMSELQHRKEVLDEIDKLGVPAALAAAENLVRKVRREAAAAGVPRANGADGYDDQKTLEPIRKLARMDGGRETIEVLQAIVGMFANRIGEHKRRSDALEQRIAALEQRVEQRLKAFEQRPVMKYVGIWNELDAYHVGEFCTFKGALWHAWEDNRGTRPGSCDAWQLAVQKGRDARDRK